MGARTWRTTTTCAALLLTATGCMVGPTIKDTPKKPAAGATDLPTPTTTGGGVAPPNGTWGTGAPQQPGASAPTPSTSPPPKYVIGGDTPFQFADKTKVTVNRVFSAGPSDKSGLVRVGVELEVRNDSGRSLKPYGLDIRLNGCVEEACGKREAQGPDAIPVGGRALVVRYFDANPQDLSTFTVEVVDYESRPAVFVWPGSS
ncbi:hypothetical protein OG216_14850 [Streptomycetaceae bacterium NBC_01309]